MVVKYALQQPDADEFIFKYPKMVIGVGQKECQSLRERFQVFREYFPDMQLLEREQLGEIEPNLIKQRNEEVVAIAVLDEYCAVDFELLSKSFVQQAKQERSKQIDTHLSTYVSEIRKEGELFKITTSRDVYQARFVVVSAGGHSLLFAHKMGYGHNYSCLPVAGSFYYVPALLNGKVYTMQRDKLPFAAIHGDPDVLMENKTRLGPTALVVPLLERHNLRSFPEFLKVLRLDFRVLKVLWDLFKVSDIRNYIIKNLFFEVPFIRRLLFLRDARKIIPSLKLNDISFARGIGGVRPVMIDKLNRKLQLGEAKINPGNGIVFNMTPSPGATSCLGNAETDIQIISNYLQCQYDEARLRQELLD